MEHKEQINSEEVRIQGLLDRYLRFRSRTSASDAHLDEDSLNAFVEGRLNKRESAPILRHLTDCSFCLNVTVELAKLEMQFAEETATVSIPAAEPTKVSDVLKGLLSRIFGSPEDNAVFAHQETEEEKKPDEKGEQEN